MGTNERRRKASRRQAAIFILLCVAVVGGFLWYQKRYNDASKLRVTFMLPDGRSTEHFKLEIASTDAERAKGLMFRQPGSMAENEGMLFVFGSNQVHSFYMKNTYMSLDMLFIDEKMKVVGILHDVPILNETPRSVGKESKYVLELNAGIAAKAGIVEGSIMRPLGPIPSGL